MQCAPQQTGRGHALRLLRPAARQLTAVAKPLQGPVASARSCVTLSSASYHHRNQPSLEPILPRATKRGCFCGMLAAATTDPRRAALVLLPSLADSDPKARSALHTRKGGKSTVHTCLARIGDTARSVRASDTSNCRYQHPPAPWQTSKGKERTPLVL